MTRNQIRSSADQNKQVDWGVFLYWGLSACLVGIAWVILHAVYIEPPGLLLTVDILGLFIFHGVLTLALERSLAHAGLDSIWHYRLAFLGSAGMTLVHWSLRLFHPAYAGILWLPLVLMLASISGALMGGLIAATINEGLWEDNCPPSEAVRLEVLKIHQIRIGKPAPSKLIQRGLDISLASVGLLLSMPVWLISIFLVWLEDPGPVFFIKNSVGKGGVNFHQFKLRTMVRGAESQTGPVLAQESDERVLWMGKLLRKTALDELPQLINILKGEMSFVGPRPQRTVLVYEYLKRAPEYAERHKVAPGLAGLAQVAGDYYLTPRQKLRFDRLYIQHASLAFDLKLLLLACLITFWYRWQPGWDGRLPRAWLRFGADRAS
jgi:lipopolysaccharide/colanic/teichoic acid biosynthesis glycosyltransferase